MSSFTSRTKSRANRFRRTQSLDIPTKANRVLNIVLISISLILFRVWHLAVIQYDDRVEEARKPRHKIVTEPAKRGTIRDRFNIPLAINKIQYQASIIYAHLRDIPTLIWEKDANGKKVKRYLRKEYITKLSKLLVKELDLSIDAERVEDLIYAKASLFYNVPFIIKEDITENQYYRLKMLEKDWPGLLSQMTPKRYYPCGKVGCDIIGFMGAIDKSEYQKVIHEMRDLRIFLEQTEAGEESPLPPGIESPEQVLLRLNELEDKAYTLNDRVGKSGIEGYFEEELRGFHGHHTYYSDAKGNFLRELSDSRPPLSGQRLLLTISAELQEFAEQLLIKNEPLRMGVDPQHQQWIKGGAIVVMDPNNGEVLALASYPRFDPNDFIKNRFSKNHHPHSNRVARWLETETYLEEIWNGLRPLEREIFNVNKGVFEEEALFLSWNTYLDLIFPPKSEVKSSIQKIKTIQQAIALQSLVNTPQSLKNELSTLETELERAMVVDLTRLIINGDQFSEELLANVGNVKLETYHKTTGATTRLSIEIKKMVKELYHQFYFKEWRKNEGKQFLKEKRSLEKSLKTYPKPYLDYFDAQESQMFEAFWLKYRWDLFYSVITGNKDLLNNLQLIESFTEKLLEKNTFLNNTLNNEIVILQNALKHLPKDIAISYLQTMRSFKELNRPLLGYYKHLRSDAGKQLEKHLASAFCPRYGFGYSRSFAYRQSTTQGSIFKLVTAYEVLSQRYQELSQINRKVADLHPTDLSPFEMVDKLHKEGGKVFVGYTHEGKSISQLYKGGRLPKSASKNLGRMDLMKALEVSSNPYFAIVAGDILHEPNDLAEAARQFSYGEKTGIELPGEIAGTIPKDLDVNRTGLYAFAIGQHSFVVTPLQTAIMMSAIANGGKVLKPHIVKLRVELPSFNKSEMERHYQVFSDTPVVKRLVDIPFAVRSLLLEAMRRVVWRSQAEGMTILNKMYQDYPEAMQDYRNVKDCLVGKTSTSEVVETLNMDPKHGRALCTHVWFGGIAFDREGINQNNDLNSDAFGTPEIVVIVYLRHGGYGKEAAPLAAQIITKWHEIKKRYK